MQKPFQCACCVHAHHCAHNLSNPDSFFLKQQTKLCVSLFQTNDKNEKFEKIGQIVFKCLSQPDGYYYRLSEQCANIPMTVMKYHSYHRDCYQSFTKNLDRLQEVEQKSLSGMNRRSLIAANKWSDGVLFNKDCIFCNKMDRIKVRVQSVWTMEGLSHFEFGGGVTVREIAIKNENLELLTRIKDVDLFSKKTMNHASCRKSFIQQLGEVLIL